MSADVALAFANYVSTGDVDYARQIGMARAPLSQRVRRVEGESNERGFEIPGTVGPREHYEPVDNNAEMNMSAATALRAAGDCAALIGVCTHGVG